MRAYGCDGCDFHEGDNAAERRAVTREKAFGDSRADIASKKPRRVTLRGQRHFRIHWTPTLTTARYSMASASPPTRRRPREQRRYSVSIFSAERLPLSKQRVKRNRAAWSAMGKATASAVAPKGIRPRGSRRPRFDSQVWAAAVWTGAGKSVRQTAVALLHVVRDVFLVVLNGEQVVGPPLLDDDARGFGLGEQRADAHGDQAAFRKHKPMPSKLARNWGGRRKSLLTPKDEVAFLKP
jgi:hypothetical protein